ncbi:MAG: HEAT repeat domain-containing protein [Balneolaceae bacterium]
MIEFLNSNAELIIRSVVLFLFFLTILVLLMAFFSRWKLRRRERRRTRVTEILGERIIRYASGDIPIEDVQKHLQKQQDYTVMLEIVNQLDQVLGGPEKERLQELMEVESTRVYFENRFRSGEPVFQAKACLWLAKRKSIQRDKISELMEMSSAGDPILAYAASYALIRHGSREEKRAALRNVLLNHRISNMAVNDLLHQLTLLGEEYHRFEMETLTQFVADAEIPPGRTALLIHVLNEMEYFHSFEFLKEYYHNEGGKHDSPEVVEAIIYAMARFGYEEILPDLQELYVNSKHSEVREAAAWAMGFFMKEESIPFLKWLVNDPNYNVCYKAARALAGYPDIDMSRIRHPNISDGDWNNLTGEIRMTEMKGGI